MKNIKKGSTNIIIGIIILVAVLIVAVIISVKLISGSNQGVLIGKNQVDVENNTSIKELIPVYNSEKKMYGLIDITGKVIVDFEYDKITEWYNTFKLEKDGDIKYVTKNNKSLDKYKNCNFEERNLNSLTDLIIAKDDINMYIINSDGKEIYKTAKTSINKIQESNTTLGVWTVIVTTEKVIILNNAQLICEVPQKEYYCLTDNYVVTKKDNILTTTQYDNSGKVIRAIENKGMIDYTDKYYVLFENSEKSEHYTRGKAKIYLKDDTFVAETYYNGTKSESYIIEDDLLLIENSDNNTTKVSIYKNGEKINELENYWLDNGTSIVNRVISLESLKDFKTYYYDENGNKLSDVDVKNNGYGFVYANYFNSYIYKGFDKEYDAKVLDAKTGDVKIDNLYWQEINNEFISNTDGKYMIVTTNDGKSAIVNDKLEVVVDYQDGYFTYLGSTVSNIYEHNKNIIYFVKKENDSAVSLIAYDTTNEIKVKFELNGKYEGLHSGKSYIAMYEDAFKYTYYDLDGKKIY